ncbi:hypothetical protein F0562_027495 [Nyssa sinensis]|uniref:Glycine-rich protein n=1 Tax=Nyssa sinensis TaxID=561372 RepID=A0A5J5B3T4_9ASTE|nr:hypothetical protein F0562_027495 [Nyssa sinensis]
MRLMLLFFTCTFYFDSVLSNSGCDLFSPVAYPRVNKNGVFVYNRDGGWDGGRGYGGRGRGRGRGYGSEDMQQESGGCNDYGGSGVAPTRGRGRGQGRGRGHGHGRGWDFRSDGPVQATA